MSNKGWMTRDQHTSEDEGMERHEAILANVEDPPGETLRHTLVFEGFRPGVRSKWHREIRRVCREHGVRIIASANYDATEDQDEQS